MSEPCSPAAPLVGSSFFLFGFFPVAVKWPLGDGARGSALGWIPT